MIVRYNHFKNKKSIQVSKVRIRILGHGKLYYEDCVLNVIINQIL